eukprot:TRINITY_DN76031_c0_g1_i1.p3 TRINITY_DN76031_c0_g1~~TRINITY_DN76031_c0_g1_i1.p3  ORF type:complete len:162 (-),score=24.48 TRINITY_DN76031_c0_g1_i1:30-515(-)
MFNYSSSTPKRPADSDWYAGDAKRPKPWGDAAEKGLCGVHNKLRAMDCLEEDTPGHFRCIEGRECRGKFDTKLVRCTFWEQGRCTKGDACDFSHSADAISAEEAWVAAGNRPKGSGKGKSGKGGKGSWDDWGDDAWGGMMMAMSAFLKGFSKGKGKGKPSW